MLWIPGKLALIHVPRTGGYAIKQAFAADLMGVGGVVVNTLPEHAACPLWCHSTQAEIAAALPPGEAERVTWLAVRRGSAEQRLSMWRWHCRYRDPAVSLAEYLDRDPELRRIDARGGMESHFADGAWPVSWLEFTALESDLHGQCDRLGLPRVRLPRVNQA